MLRISLQSWSMASSRATIMSVMAIAVLLVIGGGQARIVTTFSRGRGCGSQKPIRLLKTMDEVDPNNDGCNIVQFFDTSEYKVVVQVPDKPPQEPLQEGTWGEWQAWGSCTTTCGIGFRLRTRPCEGGQVCSTGTAKDTANCGNPNCHLSDTCFLPDVDYANHDVADKSASSPDECQQLCQHEPGCLYFSMKNSNCWLKTSNVGEETKSDFVSGPRTCDLNCLEFDMSYAIDNNEIADVVAKTIEECHERCKVDPECKFFIYNTKIVADATKHKRCSIRTSSGTAEPTQVQGVVAGTVPCIPT